MAKINYSLSTKVDKITGKAEMYIRFIGGRGLIFRGKTGLTVNPKRFINGNVTIPRIETQEQKDLVKLQKRLSELSNYIIDTFTNADKSKIKGDWLQATIDNWLFPEKYITKTLISELSFFESFTHFLTIWKISQVRKNNYMVVFRSLQRFELYKRLIDSSFKLSFDTINTETIRDFEKFMLTEPELYKKYPKIYETIEEKRVPKQRGLNTINVNMTKLRTFINWCIEEDLITKNPFRGYVETPAIYGTPYYLTLKEINDLYTFNLSASPLLADQRNIFVFQCMIGCRVSDLYSFTKDNVINGAIEYIARKTKDDRPVTVRVPLNKKASEILLLYAELPGKQLLPLILEQKYNIAIKDIFTEAGLTRMVTVLNQTTRKEEKRALNEIASSHLCRRSFIANLYNKVKDPNQVSELSGHKAGSKAFARYRQIDEGQKKELVDLLD
jgi:site-specific recombinase XerD